MSHGHDAHTGNDSPSGVMIAGLSVVLAVASAKVATTRIELVATHTEKTNALLERQAAGTRYRMMMSQLQYLHGMLPEEPAKFDAARAAFTLRGKAEKPPAAFAASAESLDLLMTLVEPNRRDALRLIDIARRYYDQSRKALVWASSYDDTMRAYARAAEHYEWIQVACEVGLVLCSLGMVLRRKRFLAAAVAILSVAALTLIATAVKTQRAVSRGHEQIEMARVAFVNIFGIKGQIEDDKKLLDELERRARGK